MGVHELRQFRRKVRAFELALDAGVFEREWEQPEFEVLVLTTTDARRRNLWRCARETVPAHRWEWYSFATIAALAGEAVLGRPWLTLRGDYAPLLYGGG